MGSDTFLLRNTGKNWKTVFRGRYGCVRVLDCVRLIGDPFGFAFAKYIDMDQKELFNVWMTGPMKPINKYGGLPKPTGCV
jgi:sulfur relay (sulfurtransferase) DsrC/TusE family protein